MTRSLAARFFLPLAILAPLAANGCSVFLPTPTPTITPTPAFTPTPSLTPTITATPTKTFAPTISPTPTKTPLPSGRSDRIDTKFHTALLNQDMPILIYLPPGYYDSQRRYPVLYMLHGYGGPYTEWEKWGLIASIDPMIRNGKIQPMIAVMPEGERSYWFNHAPALPQCPQSDGKPWGDYVGKDVVRYVDANYRTLSRRESRAIGGLSSGGQGALMLGMTHPEVFSTVGAHSPSFRGVDGSLPFFCDANYFNQYNPIWLAKNTDGARQISIWMDDGDDDDVWGEEIRKYNDLLNSLGIAHEWHSWPGRHEGTYWAPHVPDYLTWYASKLTGQ
jgi:enterochelin esterase-like enzyme